MTTLDHHSSRPLTHRQRFALVLIVLALWLGGTITVAVAQIRL